MVQMQCSFKGKENLQDKTRPEYLVGIYIYKRGYKRTQMNAVLKCMKIQSIKN